MARNGRDPKRQPRLFVAILGLAFLASVLSCSSNDKPFDRSKAVNDVVLSGKGRITTPQAECYVDRVLKELGSGALDLGTTPPPERVPRIAAIQIDCIGVVNLGAATKGSTAVHGDEFDGAKPNRLGDDPHLDSLYSACKAGSGPACDQLFDEAPLGSVYEEYAGTCGDRSNEIKCADKYPDPNWPTSSTSTGKAPVPR